MQKQMASKIGHFRDRMKEITILRNSYRERSPEFSANFNNNPEISANNVFNSYSAQIVSQFRSIESKISSLIELYQEQISASTDNFIDHDQNQQIESKIDSSVVEINKLLNGLAKSVESEDFSGESKETKELLSNLKKGYISRIRALAFYFLKMQTEHSERLKKVQSDSISEINSSTESVDYKIELPQNQNQLILRNEEEINNMNKAFDELCAQMKNLGMSFMNLNVIVSDQGKILDRIDNNVDESLNEVRSGNKQLEKAEKDQSSKCFYVYLIAMLFLIVILGTIIIIRKEMKNGRNDSNDNGNL